MSSMQTWRCDTTIHINAPDVNATLPPTTDPLRPWKYHRVPEDSTVRQVLAQFARGARHQFYKDVETKSNAVGCNQEETQAIYQTFLEARPLGRIGTLVETAFNKTFRASIHEPLSTRVLEEARDGISNKHFLTTHSEFRTRMKWHTHCAACSRDFEDGQRVVKMNNGEWRHYWAKPLYGTTFTELFDSYGRRSEDGSLMDDGADVSLDLTGTRFFRENQEPFR